MKIISNTDILKNLTENEIDYVVLRGFIPIEEINKSLDVDIYIPKKHKKKVDALFKSLGWFTAKINCSRYPHKQYIYLSDNKVNKIDIVYGLFYSNKLKHLKYEENILNNVCVKEKICILNPIMALVTFILHILYDKGNLSQKNSKYLKLMYENYQQNSKTKENINEKIEATFLNITRQMLNDELEIVNFNIEKYKVEIEKISILEYSKSRTLIYKTKQKINNIVRYSWLKLSNRSIAIIGVDGSGKSTTTVELKNILGEKAIIQYMGFKDYETNYMKKHCQNIKYNNFYNLQSVILHYFEMWHRYLKNRFSNKLIIYDRFPWEAIINSKGLAKIMYFVEFKILFPKPKKVYYLYCSEKTSLERKDDIENQEKFIKMKQSFDKEYIGKRKIKTFSTDSKSTKEILDEIVDDINKNMLKYLI